jgi:class 3 adenylate cyclase
VMFADLAGFTSWSASRQPTQVFTLLETLYAAFDEIAKQRGVFKVETIGDCYVAVVGLPTPRKGHAAVMTRFAFDCRDKTRELTLMLEETLGPVSTPTKDTDWKWYSPDLTRNASWFLQGTSSLALRIGLNSGPTTAGVLRGEKSRFQLFGDVSLRFQV